MEDLAAGPGAGWYDDPSRRMRLRWWDGAQWTPYAANTDDVVWDSAPVVSAEPPPPGLRGLVIAILGSVVGFILAVVVRFAMYAADDPGGTTAALLATQLALWSGLLGTCLYLSRRRGTGSFVRDFALRFRWIDIGLGFAGFLVARVVAVLVILPFAPFIADQSPEDDVFGDVTNTTTGWLVLIAITCVGAPLVEELYFRGLLQSRLVGRIGVASGIVVGSILFGAAHAIAWQGWITLVYALSIAGAGLVLGMMRYLSGRLGPGIAAHAFFNAQAMIVLALLN